MTGHSLIQPRQRAMRWYRSWPMGLLVVAACGGGNGGEGAEGGPPGGGGMPPMPVEVAVARTDTVVDAILATGQIAALHAIELRPEVSGRVREILVNEGATVAEGTPLIRIDDAELQAQVAQAEAERDLAAQDLMRAKGLREAVGIAQADVDRADAAARRTQAQYDLLKVRLDRTVVRAPFAGVVGQRRVSLGDYVTSQTPLITLQTVNPQVAVFDVPERFAERLRVGQRVSFGIAALPGREFGGRVDFVDPVVQPDSRTIVMKALVPNPRRELQSGMFVELRLATDTRPDAVVIPEEAVVPYEAGNWVWAVVDGKAERREVSLGVRSPGVVEIRSGVLAGEQVVVGGVSRLAPGAPVAPRVVDRTQPVVRDSTGG